MAFGVVQIHGLLILHQHDHHHYKPQAAAELHKAPMKQKNVWGYRHIHHGKAGGRPSADRFKQRLYKCELSTHDKGESPNQDTPAPCKKDGQAAALHGRAPFKF
ncbi:hypothetical protein SDC9_197921 [bioreactor metagenome]|uniref:Uncharacterized protein n=1 Tax=bioreactor metagenome TaxID=1076179 RepID=A0A645IG86_9ZZZZ